MTQPVSVVPAPSSSAPGLLSRIPRRWRIFWAVLAVLGLLVYVWEEHLEYVVLPKRWGVVEPGQIYRSGQISRFLVASQFKRHRIQAVVDLTRPDPANRDQQAELAAAAEQGIDHRKFVLSGDGTGDVREYIDALAHLRRSVLAGRPTLVHCAGGGQRTGGVIALYQLLFQLQDPHAVYEEILLHNGFKKRPIVLDYLNAHIGEVALAMVEQGLLAEVPETLPQLPPPPGKFELFLRGLLHWELIDLMPPRWRIFWGVVAALALIIYVWEEHLEYVVLPKRWGVVEPGQIYRSGQISRFLVASQFKRHRIQAVIDLTHLDPANRDQQAELAAAAEQGIDHRKFVLIGDGTGDVRQYVDALAHLRRSVLAGRPTLVHCAGGGQRTGGVIALYRLLFQQRDSRGVYAELLHYNGCKQRPIVLDYLNSHMHEVAVAMVEQGLLAKVPDVIPQLPAAPGKLRLFLRGLVDWKLLPWSPQTC